MSASLLLPIDLSASLYGTDSNSVCEKKKKKGINTTNGDWSATVCVTKKKAPANTLFIVSTSKAIWYTDVFL